MVGGRHQPGLLLGFDSLQAGARHSCVRTAAACRVRVRKLHTSYDAHFCAGIWGIRGGAGRAPHLVQSKRAPWCQSWPFWSGLRSCGSSDRGALFGKKDCPWNGVSLGPFPASECEHTDGVCEGFTGIGYVSGWPNVVPSSPPAVQPQHRGARVWQHAARHPPGRHAASRHASALFAHHQHAACQLGQPANCVASTDGT